jgi:pimeloyl-ACP methyl ester carboxylesterase
LALVSALAAGAAGCASETAYSRLCSEKNVPELAALGQRTRDHPNHTELVATHGVSPPEAPPLRVAVHEIVEPGHDRLLVFLHGVFSDSSAWRFIAGDLAEDHDLWLVDLPGCGLSDKTDPAMLGPDAYSPPDMAARILEALRARLVARGGDQRFTIVGHSLGGMLAIRMFADAGLREQFPDVLSRVDRLVLSAPLDVSINRPDPLFEELATITPIKVEIGSALGIIRERVADGVINSVDQPACRALKEEADQRIRFLNDPPTRRAMQAMLQRAVAWKGHRPDWEKNEAVAVGYKDVRPEALILWGARDEVMAPSMGYKLAFELPRAHLYLIPRILHSPHIEVPTQTASLIRAFADSGAVPEGALSRDGR